MGEQARDALYAALTREGRPRHLDADGYEWALVDLMQSDDVGHLTHVVLQAANPAAWLRLDESPAASAQMIEWYAPKTAAAIRGQS